MVAGEKGAKTDASNSNRFFELLNTILWYICRYPATLTVTVKGITPSESRVNFSQEGEQMQSESQKMLKFTGMENTSIVQSNLLRRLPGQVREHFQFAILVYLERKKIINSINIANRYASIRTWYTKHILNHRRKDVWWRNSVPMVNFSHIHSIQIIIFR